MGKLSYTTAEINSRLDLAQRQTVKVRPGAIVIQAASYHTFVRLTGSISPTITIPSTAPTGLYSFYFTGKGYTLKAKINGTKLSIMNLGLGDGVYRYQILKTDDGLFAFEDGTVTESVTL